MATTAKVDRAARALATALDGRFLKALVEPIRVEIVKLLLVNGESDIGTLADNLAPDRSVVSRHLQILHDADLVHVRKDGRHRFYSLNADTFVGNLETILSRTKSLVAMCCPPAKEAGVKRTISPSPRKRGSRS